MCIWGERMTCCSTPSHLDLFHFSYTRIFQASNGPEINTALSLPCNYPGYYAANLPLYVRYCLSHFMLFLHSLCLALCLLNLVSLTHSQRWGLMESQGGAWWWHHRLWAGCLPCPGLRRWPNDKQQQRQPIRALVRTSRREAWGIGVGQGFGQKVDVHI